MPIYPQNGDLTAGMAGSYTETIAASPDPLVTGDVPAMMATDEAVAADQVLPALTVVGFDGSGHIVEATGTIAAVGILPYAVDTTGEAAGAKFTGVYRMGVYNPDLLKWNAGYDTDLKKLKAFEGAPSPTSIVIRRPKALTV